MSYVQIKLSGQLDLKLCSTLLIYSSSVFMFSAELSENVIRHTFAQLRDSLVQKLASPFDKTKMCCILVYQVSQRPMKFLFPSQKPWWECKLIIYLVCFVLQSSSSLKIRYESWLSSSGVSLSPFHVRWHTSLFNSLFARCSRLNPHFLYIWYDPSQPVKALIPGVNWFKGAVCDLQSPTEADINNAGEQQHSKQKKTSVSAGHEMNPV